MCKHIHACLILLKNCASHPSLQPKRSGPCKYTGEYNRKNRARKGWHYEAGCSCRFHIHAAARSCRGAEVNFFTLFYRWSRCCSGRHSVKGKSHAMTRFRFLSTIFDCTGKHSIRAWNVSHVEPQTQGMYGYLALKTKFSIQRACTYSCLDMPNSLCTDASAIYARCMNAHIKICMSTHSVRDEP